MIQIIDGAGKGILAEVTLRHQIKTQSQSQNLEYFYSHNDGLLFTVLGDFASINNGTFVALHIRNTSIQRQLAIVTIRTQVLGLAGGTALPSSNTYLQCGYDRTYVSGGTAVVPVNMNRASGNVAEAVCYTNNPTLTGTFIESCRAYPDANGFLCEAASAAGGLILGLNDTVEIRIVSDHTSGIIHVGTVIFFVSTASE